MKIVSEIQRGGEHKGASVCITSRLSEEQRRDVEALGRACRLWEPVTQEPFTDSSENADPSLPCFYLYYEDTYPVSYLSVFMPDGVNAEITGYTLPGYRRQGRFARLLACAREELGNRGLNFYLVCDGQSADACAMLAHKGLAAEYSERMMAAPVEKLAQGPAQEIEGCRQKVNGGQGTESSRQTENDRQAESAIVRQEGDWYVLRNGGRALGRCRLAFFDGTAYLYGFEIEEPCRRKGWGRLFLQRLAAGPAAKAHTMLLQVSSRNEAACALYSRCGFQVTEQLDYYRI